MTKRIWAGVAWGIIATISMSSFHRLARWLGLFPIWPPTPVSVVKKIFGSGLSHPTLIVLAIVFHFIYGGFWGACLASLSKRITVWKGIALGVFLWLVMQLAVFPFLGWGVFAREMNFKIPPAALAEHLVFGAVLGWLGARNSFLAKVSVTT